MYTNIDRLHAFCDILIKVAHTLNAHKEDKEGALKLVQQLNTLSKTLVLNYDRIEKALEGQLAVNKQMKELQLKIDGAFQSISKIELLADKNTLTVTSNDERNYDFMCTPQDVGPRKIVPRVLVLAIDPLTDEELSLIPGYMLGRTTLATLNIFIENINSALKTKYKPNPKRKGGKNALSRRSDEDDELKGKTYISDAELADTLKCARLDKKSLNLLTILRHCKKIYEVRRGTVKLYVPS